MRHPQATDSNQPLEFRLGQQAGVARGSVEIGEVIELGIRYTGGLCAGHVHAGHYGDVKLDNLSFVRVGRWEGDLWARQASGVAGLYIDDHADDRQMEALPSIIGGRAGGFPAWVNECFAGGRHSRGIERAKITYEIAPDLDCSKILVPRLDEPKECDHQPVAIADRVSHFNGSTRHYLTLIHELLAKIDELHACNNRTCRALPASCRVQASFDTPKPAPVLLRHHGASSAVQGVYLDGHRMRRVCLGQVISESPHAFDGDAFGWSNFQYCCLG